MTGTPMTNKTVEAGDDDLCPICSGPFKAGDACATDIELGTCHAECLEGSPTVDLDTGEPIDGPIGTYPYEPLSGTEDGSLLSDPDLGVTSLPAARESEASAAPIPRAGLDAKALEAARGTVTARDIGEAIINASNVADETLAIDDETLVLSAPDGVVRLDLARIRADLALPHAGVSEEMVAPAECDENCDDPDCPYSHKPLTLRQAYENALVRLRSAEAALSSQHAEAAPVATALCSDCPPIGYLPDETRCTPCPRRSALVPTTSPAKGAPVGKETADEDWDGLDCYCGGGWKVGHAVGCPEANVEPQGIVALLAYIDAIDALDHDHIDFPDDRFVTHGKKVGGFTYGDLRALRTSAPVGQQAKEGE